MTASARQTPSRAVLVAAAVIAAVVIAAVVVALTLSGGDDDSTEASPIDAAAEADTAAAPDTATETDIAIGPQEPTLPRQVLEVSDAAIGGAPLPTFDPELGVDPAVGMAAPSITASYFDDTETTRDFGDGKPTVLVFVAHWCSHCQAEVAALSGWFDDNGVPDDVNVVAISTAVDSGGQNYPPSEWLVREQWPLPVLRDSSSSDLAAGFGLSGFPYMVIVNGDGEVVSRHTGGRPLSVWEANLDLARSS